MAEEQVELLRTLPGDDVRQIMWRFSDRFDIQMLVQSTRAVARGPVARLVADGARKTHEWTEEKHSLLKHFDDAGITGAFLPVEYGGVVDGPKNFLLALIAFELAWVDAGAATCSLAGDLAFAPIAERGTREQQEEYMRRMTPPPPGEPGEPLRGAFALTEPLPYVGVETGTLCGKVRVASWEEGSEPILQVEKRGRFITNMDFAQYVTAAVDSDDERIKGSCMIILEESDEGTFDRGAPILKTVHQLSSTRDPVLSLKVPASRIIGGYTVKDGVIIPNYSHSDVIEAVFKRTRITVGLMTSAKLLSAIEPVIRYQRSRFRGSAKTHPGTSRYDLGLQQREDAVQRLVDVWAAGEAGASMGFATARLFDVIDPLDKEKDKLLEAQGVKGGWGQLKVFRKREKEAFELIALRAQPESERDNARLEALEQDTIVRFMVEDAVGNVLCPACKLWNTGYGATMMREAVSLMGGYGITEDCPGFLIYKWHDAQLEATYEGPEVVQRRQMSITMAMPLFLAHFKVWINEMEQLAVSHPQSGAGILAQAMKLWLHTMEFLKTGKDGYNAKLYNTPRQGVTFPMADALCWLLASRLFLLDVLELEKKGPENPVVAEGLEGLLTFMFDLCHVQAGRAAGETGRICGELMYGYGTPEEGREETEKARETFEEIRIAMNRKMEGMRLAKDRAGKAVSQVMIPEALDYPLQ